MPTMLSPPVPSLSLPLQPAARRLFPDSPRSSAQPNASSEPEQTLRSACAAELASEADSSSESRKSCTFPVRIPPLIVSSDASDDSRSCTSCDVADDDCDDCDDCPLPVSCGGWGYSTFSDGADSRKSDFDGGDSSSVTSSEESGALTPYYRSYYYDRPVGDSSRVSEASSGKLLSGRYAQPRNMYAVAGRWREIDATEAADATVANPPERRTDGDVTESQRKPATRGGRRLADDEDAPRRSRDDRIVPKRSDYWTHLRRQNSSSLASDEPSDARMQENFKPTVSYPAVASDSERGASFSRGLTVQIPDAPSSDDADSSPPLSAKPATARHATRPPLSSTGSGGAFGPKSVGARPKIPPLTLDPVNSSLVPMTPTPRAKTPLTGTSRPPLPSSIPRGSPPMLAERPLRSSEMSVANERLTRTSKRGGRSKTMSGITYLLLQTEEHRRESQPSNSSLNEAGINEAGSNEAGFNEAVKRYCEGASLDDSSAADVAAAVTGAATGAAIAKSLSSLIQWVSPR